MRGVGHAWRHPVVVDARRVDSVSSTSRIWSSLTRKLARASANAENGIVAPRLEDVAGRP